MFRGTSNFDKLLDKATSHLLLETDWNTTLLLCDSIRQGDVQPKYAITALKKKLYNQNPHVILFSLEVLESWVKNCGSPIHLEVATKQFMEELKDITKETTNDKVKSKILELIQTWAFAFRNEPNYRALQDTLNLMKIEGYNFPELRESDAMFVADQAPEWLDGECCHRCRVNFGVMIRKHHCRNCGQVFCGKCSAKSLPIPRIGFEKEVRVCDSCYDTLSKPTSTSQKPGESELPQEYLASSLSQQPQVPPSKSEQEIQEEEDLQLAIALSKSEAENKEKEKLRATNNMLSQFGNSNPNAVVSSAPSLDSTIDSDSPELSRYLNRNYWEQKHVDGNIAKMGTIGGLNTVDSHGGPIPSAPASAPGVFGVGIGSSIAQQVHVAHPIRFNDEHQNGEVEELDDFAAALRGNLEIFVNRMKSNSSRGRSIAVDSTVQTVFLNITAMHSQLLKFIQEQEDNRVYYEGLQDKISQAKDARAALDALREEHRERLRREAEEAERIRQIQMAQKLEIMRKKKQEYLQYQRQMAMQRMQEEEREMQLRQEQQKQQYMRQLGGMGVGGAYPPQGAPQQMPSQPPGGGYVSSPPPTHGFNPQPMTVTSSNESPIHGAPQHFQAQYHFSPPQAGYQPQGPPPQQPSDFQTYNLQGLVNNLPGLPMGAYPAQHIMQQQHPQAAPPPPPQPLSQNAPPIHGVPPGSSEQAAGHFPGRVPPPPQSAAPQPQPPVVQANPLEAELISFD